MTEPPATESAGEGESEQRPMDALDEVLADLESAAVESPAGALPTVIIDTPVSSGSPRSADISSSD